MNKWQMYINRKFDIADQLYNGCCGAGYIEAIMILAHLVSGIASDIWPGERIDKKRFVELWSRKSDPSLSATKISIPLLVQRLREEDDINSAEKIESERPEMFGFGYSTKMLIGEDVDMNEEELQIILPTMKLKEIRSFSYGVQFYKCVRSGISHEFHLTKNATQEPMSKRTKSVSYSNRPSCHNNNSVERLIYFDFLWVEKVARSIASNLSSTSDWPEQKCIPQKWWIDGG